MDPGSQNAGFLIGSVGTEYVANALSTHKSLDAAIKDVQTRGGLKATKGSNVLTGMLGLLQHLGMSRADIHRAVLEKACTTMLERIPRLPSSKLHQLLDETFPYIKLPELNAIPLAILEQLKPLPRPILKDISEDETLFKMLPPSVQHQVWEVNSNLLRRHALSSITKYVNETATTMSGLNMDMAGPGAAACQRGSLPSLPRKSIRAGSPGLRELVAMVGGSRKIYTGIVNFIRMQYAEKGDPTLCSMRSQLLMALHDNNANDLCQQDQTCHELAWCLDACLRERAINERHLAKLQKGLLANVPMSSVASDGDLREGARKVPRKDQSRGPGADMRETGNDSDGGGESTSRPDEALSELIGNAAMILSDPPVLHLLLHELVRALEAVVERFGDPASGSDHLLQLAKLVTLALESQRLNTSDQKSTRLPAPSYSLMHEILPMIGCHMADWHMRESDEERLEVPAGADLAVDEHMVGAIQGQAAVRKVLLTYILVSLQRRDLAGAVALLHLAAAALKGDALLSEAPFVVALSRQVTALEGAGVLGASHPLWDAAVSRVLLKGAAINTAVHEEVLRMLTQTGKSQTAEHLTQRIDALLNHTKRQRKHEKKSKKRGQALPGSMLAAHSDPSSGPETPTSAAEAGGGFGYSSGGGGRGMPGMYGDGNSSAGEGRGRGEGGRGVAEAGAEGLRGLYASLAAKHSGKLTEESSPQLFAYLNAA